MKKDGNSGDPVSTHTHTHCVTALFFNLQKIQKLAKVKARHIL